MQPKIPLPWTVSEPSSILSTERSDVMLICMPWQCEALPSLQISLLKAHLARDGIAADTAHLNLDYLGFVTSKGLLSFEEFQFIAQRPSRQLGIAEWLFRLPRPGEDAGADEQYFGFLASNPFQRPEEREFGAVLTRRRLEALRDATPQFLEGAADLILARQPRVVGFTTMFFQTNPSLALSCVLKRRDPTLKIIFGGASCEGAAGAALARNFSSIDVVVRGEAEPVLTNVVKELIEGRAVTPRPGLCIRRPDGIEVVDSSSPMMGMNDMPIPDYDEYFARLLRHPLRDRIMPDVEILFETSRGCWWGAKHHCVFCGLNGQSMAFRSKSADRVIDEMLALSTRYRHLKFMAVDNIIDTGFFATLLPRLAEIGIDFSIWAETKSNLKKADFALMRRSGLNRVNIGIESLSTPVLKIMKKGVSGLNNVRSLKWAAQHGISVSWVVLYGFPGEPKEVYSELADAMLSLTHLPPPNWPTPIRMDRFSPLHNNPAAFGLTSVEPFSYYRYVFDVGPDALTDLAYHFSFRYGDDRDPETYIEPVKRAVEIWRSRKRGTLTYARGAGFLVITDTRTGETVRHFLDRDEALVYLGCDAGATPGKVWEGLPAHARASVSQEAVEGLLQSMHARRLVYREGDYYLSLALPVVDDERAPDWDTQRFGAPQVPAIR